MLERRGTSDDRITLPEPARRLGRIRRPRRRPSDRDQDWYRDGDTLVALRTVRPPGYVGGFGYPWQELVVTYTHGYETVPRSSEASASEMVVRIWVNLGSVEREGTGPSRSATPTGASCSPTARSRRSAVCSPAATGR
ncbi:MAG: hypothetical protein M5T61_21430 [Acidimicrobiia bacterium]|nr:hypothetical protein [Acidimicrobiia bacterium]